jgi:hypothetical protein
MWYTYNGVLFSHKEWNCLFSSKWLELEIISKISQAHKDKGIRWVYTWIHTWSDVFWEREYNCNNVCLRGLWGGGRGKEKDR